MAFSFSRYIFLIRRPRQTNARVLHLLRIAALSYCNAHRALFTEFFGASLLPLRHDSRPQWPLLDQQECNE